MSKSRFHLVILAVSLSVFSMLACSKQSNQSSASASSGSSQQSSTAPSPSTQPASNDAPKAATQPATADPPMSAQKGRGVPATEKYRLGLANYSNVPVTVSVNGEWVGQWDSSSDVPLQPVFQGKNQLTVEVPTEPKNLVTVAVYTERDGQRVNLLTLNFQGKSGTQNFFFAGK